MLLTSKHGGKPILYLQNVVLPSRIARFHFDDAAQPDESRNIETTIATECREIDTMKPHQTNAVNEALMLSTRDVAKLMQCSDRHITNLRKQGRMPPCIKLGTLVRWPRKIIEDWIAVGCPAVGESVQPGSANDLQVA